jgi:hypothetical protein
MRQEFPLLWQTMLELNSPFTFINVSDSSCTSATFCKVCLIVATPLSKARRTHKGAVRQLKMGSPKSYFWKPNIAVLYFAQARCRVDKEIPAIRHHF